MICDRCMHNNVCGIDGALTYCRDFLGWGWIPVSERLPEEDKTVIASTKYGVYPEARYTEENGWEWAYESGADYWEKLEDVEAWMPLPKHYKPQQENGGRIMTYGDIYNEFCKKFPNVEVEDYRPAAEIHILQLSRAIPNAIIVWLKDGSKVIYIAESEEIINGRYIR